MDGLLRVPVGSSQQTWIDADDIAAAGVAALQRSDLVGEILNVTGPETASFPEVAATISHATGRDVEFDGTEEGYRASLGASGVPPQDTEAILSGFRALAAHEHHPTPDLERATGRRGTPHCGTTSNEPPARGSGDRSYNLHLRERRWSTPSRIVSPCPRGDDGRSFAHELQS